MKRLLSQDHFSVDGTLIQAWASMKSFRPKDDTPPDSPEPPAGGRNAEVDFHGQRLSNDTHRSTTDPEARLYRKGRGREAKLCFMGHALMENRNGLIVDGCVTEANGHAERTAALVLIEKRAERPGRITLGADKGYDAADFVNELRSMNVTPHIAQNTAGRRSAIDGRTTRHPGYAVSQRVRKRIEEGFGWGKEIGLLRRIRVRGRERVDMAFAFSAAACNLIRLPKLLRPLTGRWARRAPSRPVSIGHDRQLSTTPNHQSRQALCARAVWLNPFALRCAVMRSPTARSRSVADFGSIFSPGQARRIDAYSEERMILQRRSRAPLNPSLTHIEPDLLSPP